MGHYADQRLLMRGASAGHLWDDQGRRYLDLTSGWNVVNAGWNNPEISKVWRDCVETLPFRPSWCTDEYSLALTKTFSTILHGYTLIPGCTGADGIDNALKVARLVTGRAGVISFAGAYHGSSTGAALAAGYEIPHFQVLGIGRNDNLLPPPTEDDVLTTAERVIRRAENVGAIVFETVLTNAGCCLLSDKYLKLLRQLADELGMLLICDEIGTGFGRTGKMFGHEGKVKPDIVVCGKALSNGLFPLSVTLVSNEFVGYIEWEAFASTYAGVPLGCAAALATIDYHIRYDLKSQASRSGAEVKRRLFDNLSRFNLFSEVHGEGLELAVHLDWIYGGSIGLQPDELLHQFRNRGLFTILSASECHIMIMPPLNSQLADLLAAMDVIGEVMEQYG